MNTTKKQWAEWSQFARLAGLLSPADGLTFPLTVIHDDKPDFQVTFSGGNVGIEMTEFTDAEFHYATAIQREFGGTMCVTDLKDRTEPRGREEVMNSMYGGQGFWVTSDQQVEHILRKVETAIETKRQKFLGFKKFQRNWLVLGEWSNAIDDDFHATKIQKGIASLISRGTVGLEFDRVYLFYGELVWRFDATSLSSGAGFGLKLDVREDGLWCADGSQIASRLVT